MVYIHHIPVKDVTRYIREYIIRKLDNKTVFQFAKQGKTILYYKENVKQ